MPTKPVAVRLDQETLERLDVLAKEIQRPRAWIMARAIRKYVSSKEQFMDAVSEGAAASDRGDYISERKVNNAFKKWGVKS